MDSMHLSGSEDVLRAAHMMRAAADDMRSAASSIQSTFEQQQRFMEGWLQDLKAAFGDTKDAPLSYVLEKMEVMREELTEIRKNTFTGGIL